MQTLNFQLITNDSKKINSKVNYFQKNSILNFKIEDDIYQFNIEECLLVKKDQEKEITMDFKKKVIIIHLFSNNIKIDYPMDKCTYQIHKNHVELIYTLNQDIVINNKILIDY